jgi:hypothetical protein
MDPNNPINVCSLLKSNTNTFCRTQQEEDAGRRTTTSRQDAAAGAQKEEEKEYKKDKNKNIARNNG